MPLSSTVTLQYLFWDNRLDFKHLPLTGGTIKSFVSRGHWSTLKEGEGLSWRQWALVSFPCSCAAVYQQCVCMGTAGGALLHPYTRNRRSYGDLTDPVQPRCPLCCGHPVKDTTYSRPCTHGNSVTVHSHPQPCLSISWTVFPEALRPGHHIPTAVPQLPPCLCSPTSTLLPRH